MPGYEQRFSRGSALDGDDFALLQHFLANCIYPSRPLKPRNLRRSTARVIVYSEVLLDPKPVIAPHSASGPAEAEDRAGMRLGKLDEMSSSIVGRSADACDRIRSRSSQGSQTSFSLVYHVLAYSSLSPHQYVLVPLTTGRLSPCRGDTGWTARTLYGATRKGMSSFWSWVGERSESQLRAEQRRGMRTR